MDKSIDKLIKLFKDNTSAVLIILAVLGLVLMFGGNFIKTGTKNETSETFDESKYIESLESRIVGIVSEIRGAGNASVMINIVSTTESVYVKENKKSYDSGTDNSKSETQDSIITMTDGSGNQYALVTKKIMPEIGGVTVVCEGGGDQNVKAAVINAVSTVLNIGANKVCVIAKAN